MLLGIILGYNYPKIVPYLKPLGDIFINLLFMLIVPLIFFLIASTTSNWYQKKQKNRIVLITIIIFCFTSFISSLWMLGIFSLSNPRPNLSISEETISTPNLNFGEKITETFTVDDFSKLLTKNHLLPLIIFAALYGTGIAKMKEKDNIMKKWVDTGQKICLNMIDIIMNFAPIGIMAYFANLIVEMGPKLIGTYAKYLFIYFMACILYFLIFYSLYAYLSFGKKGLKNFWQNISLSAFTSFSTCSSIGTLPANMTTAEKLNIPSDVRNISLSLGAATHMEGSSMGTILKIMFLFAVFNRNFFTPTNIIVAILFSTFICTAMSGVPSGGLISEMLILYLFQFPPTAYAFITTIAWLIDAPATCLNATGDIPASMLISKILKKAY